MDGGVVLLIIGITIFVLSKYGCLIVKLLGFTEKNRCSCVVGEPNSEGTAFVIIKDDNCLVHSNQNFEAPNISEIKNNGGKDE